MRRIYKYPLAVDLVQELALPVRAQLLTVQMQHGRPCLWAIVDDDECLMTKYRLRTYATGESMADEDKFPRYLGTYQLNQGELVFHVFTNLQ